MKATVLGIHSLLPIQRYVACPTQWPTWDWVLTGIFAGSGKQVFQNEEEEWFILKLLKLCIK